MSKNYQIVQLINLIFKIGYNNIELSVKKGIFIK